MVAWCRRSIENTKNYKSLFPKVFRPGNRFLDIYDLFISQDTLSGLGLIGHEIILGEPHENFCSKTAFCNFVMLNHRNFKIWRKTFPPLLWFFNVYGYVCMPKDHHLSSKNRWASGKFSKKFKKCHFGDFGALWRPLWGTLKFINTSSGCALICYILDHLK